MDAASHEVIKVIYLPDKVTSSLFLTLTEALGGY